MIDLSKFIWGIDISQWQDDYSTPKKPDLQKAKELGAKFVIVRCSYGTVIDRTYREFIDQAIKIGLPYAVYGYMDYFSQTKFGISSSEWGRRQGKAVAALLKDYPARYFQDVESASGQVKIETVWKTAITIMDNMIWEIDDATGCACGMYIPTGWLKKYHPYHKMRPLFAANYNEVTDNYVRKVAEEAGWLDLCMWQVTSSGDINGDGVPDGLRMGMETKTLDIDVWLKNDEEFQKFFEIQEPSQPEPSIIISPVDEKPEETIKMKLVELKKVAVSSLRIRTSTGTPNLFSPVPDKLPQGAIVEVLQRIVSGNYVWVRIGYRQWCCETEISGTKKFDYLVDLKDE